MIDAKIVARPAQEVLAWSRSLIDPALREAVHSLPASMRRIAGYHLGWWDADGGPTGDGTGGKAFRPAITLLAAQAAGGDPAPARPAAVAVELVHNFSLIQDDVIDGDLTRRHRPTAWSVFGPAAAILAGDALLALALDVLCTDGHPAMPHPATPHPARTHPARTLHAAAMALLEGQHADVSFEDRTDVDLLECQRMASGKTGALLGAAAALGGIAGGATQAQVMLLHGFGEQLGVAFQLADDLLGIWGDPAVTGKPVHADLRRRKKSMPLVAALTSGTRAGDELAARYRREQPLAEEELAPTAGLVDRAGGRAWCRRKADDLLADALRDLSYALDPSRATAELADLARLAVHRDR